MREPEQLTPHAIARLLTTHEIDVLRMMIDEREFEWGAWVSACLESLRATQLCTPGPSYQITDRGRAVLQAIDGGTDV